MQKARRVIGVALAASLIFAVTYFLFLSKGTREQGANISMEHFGLYNTNAGSQISETTILGSEHMLYENTEYGFTLEYPGKYSITSYDEGHGDSIVFQGKDDRSGFQLFVSYVGADVNLSQQMIVEQFDSTGIYPEGFADVTIANHPRHQSPDNIPATIFTARDERIGQTREAWFVVNGILFQAVTYKGLDLELAEVLATFDTEVMESLPSDE